MGESRDGIQSMTGYGRASRQTEGGTVTAELRSTNHRFLEVDQRLPNGFSVLEGRIAELIRHAVRRGRIEATITLQGRAGRQQQVRFNEPLLTRYFEALQQLKARVGLKGQVTLDHLLALPQAVLVAEERLPGEQVWETVRQALEPALRELVSARRREGGKLARDIRAQLRLIERHVRDVRQRLPKALAEQRRRLRERVQDLLGHGTGGPSVPIEQAVAIVREADIHEELVRVQSHLAYVRQTLAGRQLVGKRLDFIAQELMRETNTMGAKVNDAESAQHVVDMKGCIEKIREQVQNLE